jgi:hypothetical protein
MLLSTHVDFVFCQARFQPLASAAWHHAENGMILPKGEEEN